MRPRSRPLNLSRGSAAHVPCAARGGARAAWRRRRQEREIGLDRCANRRSFLVGLCFPSLMLGQRYIAVTVAARFGQEQLEEDVTVLRLVGRGADRVGARVRVVDEASLTADEELAARAVHV